MSDYIITKDGELKHYGVIGMKWGIRRAARKATKAARKERRAASREADKAINKSNNTWFGKEKKAAAEKNMYNAIDRYQKADKKYKAAYKKAKEQAAKDMYEKKGYDKATVERVSKMSAGKAIGQSFLMGSYGALKYNEAKGRGASTGRAAVKAVLASNLDFSTGRLASTIDGFDTRRTNKKKMKTTD